MAEKLLATVMSRQYAVLMPSEGACERETLGLEDPDEVMRMEGG